MAFNSHVFAVIALLICGSALFLLATAGGQPGSAPKNGQTNEQGQADWMTLQRVYYRAINFNVAVATPKGDVVGVDETVIVSFSGLCFRVLESKGTTNYTATNSVRYFSRPFKYTNPNECADFPNPLKKACSDANSGCPQNGTASTALFSLAFIFTFVNLILAIVGASGTTDSMKTARYILNAFVMVWFAAGLLAFSAGCIEPFFKFLQLTGKEQAAIAQATKGAIVSETVTTNYGPGFAGGLTGGILVAIAIIVEYLSVPAPSTVMTSSGLAPAAPATKAAPGIQV
jgi:hypothetical protein